MQKAAGNNPKIFAYQNEKMMPGTTVGNPIPGPQDGAYNYATLMYSAVHGQWYWQYMNNGATQGNQTVFHDPVNLDEPLLGLPGDQPGQTQMATIVFGVYVPPPPPPSMWQKMYNAVIQWYYANGGCMPG